MDFEKINMLDQNLRDFDGFLNREDVLPQAVNVVSTLRDMLISNKRGLEMLRALPMIIKNHMPLVDASPTNNQCDTFSS